MGIRGDSLSRLIQARAKLVGVQLNWTGKAVEDIDLLLLDYFHRKCLNECIWNGMRELMDSNALKDAPEEVQARFYTIVLQAQANFEMKRAQQLQEAKV